MINNSNNGGAKAKKKPGSAVSLLAKAMATALIKDPAKSVARAANMAADTAGSVAGTAGRVGKLISGKNPYKK